MIWVHIQAIAFYLFAFIGPPLITRSFSFSLKEGEKSMAAGVIIFSAIVLEAIALTWKTRALRSEAPAENLGRNLSPSAFLVGILKVVISPFLAMAGLDCLGVIEKPAWIGSVMIVVIFKEFYVLFLNAGPNRPRHPPAPWKVFLADLILLFYGCVMYTVCWENLVGAALSDDQHWILKGIEGFLIGVVFLLFYVPIRYGSFLEEFYLGPAQGKRLRLGMALAMGIAMGMYPLFM